MCVFEELFRPFAAEGMSRTAMNGMSRTAMNRAFQAARVEMLERQLAEARELLSLMDQMAAEATPGLTPRGDGTD